MKLKRNYDLAITLLAPLHIGSGRELQRDYDYVTHGGKTWVVNPDALLEAAVDEHGNLNELMMGRPAAELLVGEDNFTLDKRIGERKLFRYVLPGMPRAQGHGAVLREQYKTAQQEPYLPGSSIKGALRTVLAWHGFQERKLAFDPDRLTDNRSWASQPLERKIFGPDPNHDLLRALQVADSDPQPASNLRIVNAQVVTGSDKLGSPIEVEAIWTDTVFHATLAIDEFLRGDSAEAELHFRERWAWLEQTPTIARAWAKELLVSERDWYRQRKYDAVARLYHQMLDILEKNRLAANQFFLQIGWGGGWESKTIGRPLKQDKAQWERLLNNKRLSPARFRRREGDPFPKSRRVMVMANQPAAPLGWCLVEMKERK